MILAECKDIVSLVGRIQLLNSEIISAQTSESLILQNPHVLRQLGKQVDELKFKLGDMVCQLFDNS